MYKKSISLFLISTLSLSLSSCSFGGNNTSSNISPVTSNAISSSAPSEQAGPVSLGEVGLKSQQNVTTQEQVITLQKEVNFMQQQAVSLQDQANLLQEAASMTIRVEKPDPSAPDDPNITMEQRKTEVAKQMQELSKLATDKQLEATKAFEEINGKQSEVWKLQGQFNTIPQSGMKVQAEATITAAEAKIADLQRSINAIQAKIAQLQAAIATSQSKLQSAQTASEKTKLTDEIKNTQISLLDTQRSLMEEQNKLALEQENLLVLRKKEVSENEQAKQQEIKKQLDDTTNFQNDLNNKYNELNAAYDNNEKKMQTDGLNNMLALIKRRLIEIPVESKNYEISIEQMRREISALEIAKPQIVQAQRSAAESLQNSINASSLYLANLNTNKANALRWWNFIGYWIYSDMYNKELAKYKALVAQRNSVITSYSNQLNACVNKINEKNRDIRWITDALERNKKYFSELQEEYNNLSKDLTWRLETRKKLDQMRADMDLANKKAQEENAQYSASKEQLRKIEEEKAWLQAENAKKEADRQAALLKKTREIEAAKQAAIKAAELANMDIAKQEAARLDAMRKAEEEKLAAQKKAFEEEEMARKEKEAKEAELKKQQEKLEAEQKELEEKARKEQEAKDAELKRQQELLVTQPPSPIAIPVLVLPSAPVPTPTPTPSSTVNTPVITIVPGSISLTQNNTAIMRVFVKDADGKYITDDSVNIESLNPSVAKIKKIEKGLIEFLVELEFVSAGDAKIKVSTITSKTISVVTTAASTSSYQLPIWAVSTQGDTPTYQTKIVWSSVTGADSYKLYVQKDGAVVYVIQGDVVTSPYEIPAGKYCDATNCNGFSIALFCGDNQLSKDGIYKVWVEAWNGATKLITSSTIKIKGTLTGI